MIEVATDSFIHPPPIHFGWAHLKIKELQLPKLALGAVCPVSEREFIIEFHLLFCIELVPVYAVKLLPTVVGICRAKAALGAKTKASSKNSGINFIFSLEFDSNIKKANWKDKNQTQDYFKKIHSGEKRGPGKKFFWGFHIFLLYCAGTSV